MCAAGEVEDRLDRHGGPGPGAPLRGPARRRSGSGCSRTGRRRVLQVHEQGDPAGRRGWCRGRAWRPPGPGRPGPWTGARRGTPSHPSRPRWLARRVTAWSRSRASARSRVAVTSTVPSNPTWRAVDVDVALLGRGEASGLGVIGVEPDPGLLDQPLDGGEPDLAEDRCEVGVHERRRLGREGDGVVGDDLRLPHPAPPREHRGVDLGEPVAQLDGGGELTLPGVGRQTQDRGVLGHAGLDDTRGAGAGEVQDAGVPLRARVERLSGVVGGPLDGQLEAADLGGVDARLRLAQPGQHLVHGSTQAATTDSSGGPIRGDPQVTVDLLGSRGFEAGRWRSSHLNHRGAVACWLTRFRGSSLALARTSTTGVRAARSYLDQRAPQKSRSVGSSRPRRAS